MNAKMTYCYPGKFAFIGLILVVALLDSIKAESYTVSKIAGTYASSGFIGDGGFATSAKLNLPFAVNLDTTGVMTIADFSNFRIRQVDASGIITTIFGSSSSTYAGNDGSATAATGYVTNIQTDTVGNLFFEDKYNNVVRKIFNGIVSLVAGGGTLGNLNSNVDEGVSATAAKFSSPSGAFPDTNGNLFIAVANYNKVKKVVLATGIITTVAGTGAFVNSDSNTGDGGPATSAPLFSPGYVCLDAVNRLFIASSSSTSIRVVDLNTGIITFVSGGYSASGTYSGDGGPASSASLNYMADFSMDSSANIYIAGSSPGVIRKIDAATNIIYKIAGGGSLTDSQAEGQSATAVLIGGAYDVFAYNDKVYYADGSKNVISKLTLAIVPTCDPSVSPSNSPTVVPSLPPSPEPSLYPTTNPSVIPTESPSMIPSVNPTTNPTIGPSVVPTTKPSLIPTVTPTQCPSVAPTDEHSVVPTERPSAAPTVTPSTAPTAQPTMYPTLVQTGVPTAPTRKPTAKPSAKPSRATLITNAPTFCPSFSPTATPTTYVDISFNADLTLHNTTDSSLNAADTTAVITAVAAVMNVNGGVSVVNSTIVSGRRRLEPVSGPPYTLQVVVNVVASTADHPGLNGSALYRSLSGALVDSVVSEGFIGSLGSSIHQYSAYGLYYVSGVDVAVHSYFVVPAAGVSDDGKSDNDNGLSIGDFAGIVIGIIVSFMVCGLCVYVYFVLGRRGSGSDGHNTRMESDNV